jgi:4-hydroxybenzoyl-CoA thioesterase
VSASFVREKLIRFHHCDPAGIVFYPQYFVLMHEVVEDWFTDGLDCDYAAFIAVSRLGIPMAHLESSFLAPARLGEHLAFHLGVSRIGNSSLTLDVDARGGTTLRFRATFTVVLTSLASGRPQPIPDDLRRAMERYLDASNASEGGDRDAGRRT